MQNTYKNPEPVPSATQLSVMPFLAAVQGALVSTSPVPGLRVTLHRSMSREGSGYIQQISGYFPIADSQDWSTKIGRVFPVTEGIMGKSYDTGKIYRTREFDSNEELLTELKHSMDKNNEVGDPEKIATSYLSIPFIGTKDEVVLLLYAECKARNFFAEDSRIELLVSMCKSFCQLFDALQNDPFPNLRNFPLEPGSPVTATPTVYGIQEPCDCDPPRFGNLSSFNFEASVA